MPPISKNPKGKNPPRDRRSRSRNTTPIGNVPLPSTSESSLSQTYLSTSIAPLTQHLGLTVEEILDRGGSVANIPYAGPLNSMHEAVKSQFLRHVKLRGEICDRVLRELSKKRNERAQRDREHERIKRENEERRPKLKKIPRKREPEEERPHAVGAHGVARQDGVDVHKEASSSMSSPISQPPPSAGTAPPDSAISPSVSEEDHQPAPAPSIPHYQTFGPDPSTFPDPTVYDIRPITPNMTEDEKKEIFCVAHYPDSDLNDLTPGTPPDKDFSNAKPANQISANVFAQYVETFIKPLGEEDMAFLKERGDRLPYFTMPRRGERHYRDVWREQDDMMDLGSIHTKPSSTEPRGSIEDMNDDVAETDEVSVGPTASRLAALLRPEPNQSKSEAATNGDANGINGDSMDLDPSSHDNDGPEDKKPALHHPDHKSITVPLPNPDYASLDERLKMELRHLGLIPPNEQPDYGAHFDDEVASRIRILQEALREQTIKNGAMKARLLELSEGRMAQQEFRGISDDLDAQLNQAYLKRNRAVGKSKSKSKRPGGHVVAAGSGRDAHGRPMVGESIRGLMDRRRRWRDTIGPVVGWGDSSVPKDSVFNDDVMVKYYQDEQEALDREVNGLAEE